MGRLGNIFAYAGKGISSGLDQRRQMMFNAAQQKLRQMELMRNYYAGMLHPSMQLGQQDVFGRSWEGAGLQPPAPTIDMDALALKNKSGTAKTPWDKAIRDTAVYFGSLAGMTATAEDKMRFQTERINFYQQPQPIQDYANSIYTYDVASGNTQDFEQQYKDFKSNFEASNPTLKYLFNKGQVFDLAYRRIKNTLSAPPDERTQIQKAFKMFGIE